MSVNSVIIGSAIGLCSDLRQAITPTNADLSSTNSIGKKIGKIKSRGKIFHSEYGFKDVARKNILYKRGALNYRPIMIILKDVF